MPNYALRRITSSAQVVPDSGRGPAILLTRNTSLPDITAYVRSSDKYKPSPWPRHYTTAAAPLSYQTYYTRPPYSSMGNYYSRVYDSYWLPYSGYFNYTPSVAPRHRNAPYFWSYPTYTGNWHRAYKASIYDYDYPCYYRPTSLYYDPYFYAHSKYI